MNSKCYVNKPVRLAYDICKLDIIENILSKTRNLELLHGFEAQNLYNIFHDLNKTITTWYMFKSSVGEWLGHSLTVKWEYGSSLMITSQKKILFYWLVVPYSCQG